MNVLKRKYYFPILLLIVFLLAACNTGNGNSNNLAENVEDDSAENQATTATSNDKTNDTTNDNQSNNEDNANGPLSEVEKVLQKATETTNSLSGMKIEGTTYSKRDTMGKTVEDKSEISGELSLEPARQHIEINSTSASGDSFMEIYMADGGMYTSDSSAGEWLLMPMGEGGLFNNNSMIVTESQIKYFSEVYDLFEVKQDSDRVTLTYSGEGEEFKQVAFAGVKDFGGDELFDNFTNVITDIIGTYEFVIEKDSYYIVELRMEFEQTMNFDSYKTFSHEKLHYKYSDFNNIDEIVVPEEVKEQAKITPVPNMETND